MAGNGSTRVVFNRQAPALLAVVAAPKVAKAAEIIADAQRRAIPVSHDGSYGRPPGYARDSIGVFPRRRPPRCPLRRRRDRDHPRRGESYPAILDAGSRPHVITSHGNYPLRNRHTGQIFGKVVHHPGTRPTYWCRNSIHALAGRTL
jgi:hypothetical protein